jgi:hypothetical protein
MLAMALALVLQTTDAGSAATTAPAPADQWWSTVQVGGWTFLEGNPQQAFYIKDGPSKDGVKRVWQRIEYRFSPVQDHAGRGGEYLSQELLYEVDCASGRLRYIQATSHMNNNLKGETVNLNLRVPSAWEFPAPDTDVETIWNFTCAAHAGDSRHRRRR